MKEPGQRVYKKNDAVISRKIAGEMILVPIRGNLADMRRIFTLNPVAEYIWDRVDGEKSIQNIGRGIVSAFDVTPESAERDLEEFVSALLKEQLIAEVK
jgi:hypothetical protein